MRIIRSGAESISGVAALNPKSRRADATFEAFTGRRDVQMFISGRSGATVVVHRVTTDQEIFSADRV